MDLTRPFATVTPTLDGDVLGVLASHDQTFTTGQIHRILNTFSEEGIRKVLTRLVGQGVVSAQRVGPANAYRLNVEHLAAEPILALARLSTTLLDRLEHHLDGWATPPSYAAIFGSAARGTMTAHSDIDLFLIRDDAVDPDVWSRQVHTVSIAVTRWTGNDTRAIDYTTSELHVARTEPVVRDVLDHGLTVAGSRAWLMRQVGPASTRRA